MASASAARALDAFSNPKAVKALEQMNITVKDAKGNFLPLVDILSQLSAKLGKLPQPQRVAALVDAFKGAGGTIQAMRFIQLAVKPDLFKDFQADLKAMNNSTGQFGNAYGLMAGTVESKTQLLKNNFNIVKESIGEILTPAFNKLLSFLTKILQAFNKLPESTRRTIINIVFFGSVLSIAAGIVLVVLGGIGALVAALAALGLSFGEVIAIMAGFTAVLAAIGAAAYLAWKKSKPLRDIFVSIGQELRAAWTNDIKPFIDSLVEGFDKRVKPALDELWQVINEKVLPILDELQKKYGKDFVKNLKEILNWLQKVADKGFTYVAWTIKHWLIPAIKDAIKFYEDHKKGIDKVLKVLEWLAKWIGKIAGSAILGALIAALILVIGAIVLLIEGTIALVDWIQKLIHWFSVAIDWVKSYFKWLFGLGDTTKKAKDAIVEAVKGIPGDIQNALAGAEQWLFNTGMKVIDGFISGMTSSLGKLGNFLSSVGNFIVQHKGPPSKDRQLLRNTGRLVMQGFGMGIKDMMPSLNAQLKDVTGKVVSVARGQVPRTTVLNRPVTSHKTVNNNITVNTHEMDPEAQAAKLGFLLAARTA
jgi:phage-related protein